MNNLPLEDSNYAEESKVHHNQDALGYAPFAKMLSKIVQEIKGSRGTVIGLYGPWGTGKTSCVNFTLSYLRELPPTEQPIVISFNPSWFTGEHMMATRFYEAVISSLDKNKIDPNAINAIKSLLQLLEQIPSEYGWLAKTGAFVLGQLGKRNAAELKDKAANELKKARRRILVIVDDIDRILPDEVLTICRLLKLISELPNVVCLIAMDHKVVSNALNVVYSVREIPIQNTDDETNLVDNFFGQHFIEKIVQVPFNLPIADPDAMQGLVADAITETTKDYDVVFDMEYFRTIYKDGLEVLLNTPRRILKFKNTVRATFAAVKGEVHMVDFLAIEAIRLYCPEFYQVMRDNSEYFAGTERDNLPQVSQQEVRSFNTDLLNQVQSDIRDAISNIIQALFPKVSTAIGRQRLVSQGEIHDERLRARHSERYPTYFAYGAIQQRLTNTEIKTIISSSASDLVFRLEELIRQKRPNGGSRFLNFLEQLPNYLNDLTEEERSKFIGVFFETADKLIISSDYGKGYLHIPMGNQHHIVRIIFSLLRRFDTDADRFEILEQNFNKAGSFLIAALILERIRDTFSPSASPNRNPLIKIDNFRQLEKVFANKLHKMSFDELLNLPDPRLVFASWANSDRTALKNWTDKHLSSDEAIKKLLICFANSNNYDFKTLNIMFGLGPLKSKMVPLHTDDQDIHTAVEYLLKCIALSEQQRGESNFFDDRIDI